MFLLLSYLLLFFDFLFLVLGGIFLYISFTFNEFCDIKKENQLKNLDNKYNNVPNKLTNFIDYNKCILYYDKSYCDYLINYDKNKEIESINNSYNICINKIIKNDVYFWLGIILLALFIILTILLYINRN